VYCALDIFNTAFFSAVPSLTATDDRLLMFDPITELADAKSEMAATQLELGKKKEEALRAQAYMLFYKKKSE
jgi:hypothetical protein